MPKSVEIRPFDLSHYSHWTPLWDGFLSYYGKSFSEDHNKTTFQHLCGDGSHSGLGLWLGEDMIGIVHYHSHKSTWSLKPSVYLEDLFVSEAARGTGGGRKLIEAVVSAAKDLGASNVYWHTEAGNDRARALYDSMAVLSDYVRYDLAINTS
jgi:GNAT superfamily N-acetyltransferase